MNTLKKILPLLLLTLLVLVGCKKEDDVPKTEGAFSASKTTVTVDEEIQFTNNSKNAASYVWSFGDGTTSTDANPKKSYSTSGSFVVSMTATGAGGTSSSNITVIVTPLAAFAVEDEANISSGNAIQFTNQSKGATSYEWNFGDQAQTKSTEQNPEFTYAAAGTYTVSLKATGAGGSATATKEITVKQGKLPKDLYFIELDLSLIKKVSLATGSTPSDFLDIIGKAGVGLAYDGINDKIYFSDFEVVGEGKIWRMNGDGSNLQEIASGITDPYSIAINVTGGKIYWADDNGNISRANLDGSGVETSFINVPDGQMRGIAFDSKSNKLYFYEVQAENLYVANADGSGVTVLVPGVYGYGIFVDEANGKLYYDERNSQSIIQSNLDGSGAVTFATTGKTRIHGFAIDSDNNKLYWADRDLGEIRRANLDGTNAETFLSGLKSPRGLFIK